MIGRVELDGPGVEQYDFDLLGYDVGVTRFCGGLTCTGKLGELDLVKSITPESAVLFQRAAEGADFDKLTLRLGSGKDEYLRYTFDDVRLGSLRHETTGDGRLEMLTVHSLGGLPKLVEGAAAGPGIDEPIGELTLSGGTADPVGPVPIYEQAWSISKPTSSEAPPSLGRFEVVRHMDGESMDLLASLNNETYAEAKILLFDPAEPPASEPDHTYTLKNVFVDSVQHGSTGASALLAARERLKLGFQRIEQDHDAFAGCWDDGLMAGC